MCCAGMLMMAQLLGHLRDSMPAQPSTGTTHVPPSLSLHHYQQQQVHLQQRPGVQQQVLCWGLPWQATHLLSPGHPSAPRVTQCL